MKAITGNGYRFVPKGGTFPTENHHACCEELRFVRSIYPNLPQMGQKLYHDMLMPLHDSMPSFMNFKQFLDLLEFKNRTGHPKEPFVFNRCTNPALTLHTGVLSETIMLVVRSSVCE